MNIPKSPQFVHLETLIAKYQNVSTTDKAQRALDELNYVKDSWNETRNQYFGYLYGTLVTLIGHCYALTNQYEKAVETYKEALTNIDADYPEFGQAVKRDVNYNLGIALCHLGRNAEAAECFHKKVYWEMFDLYHTAYPSISHFSFRGISEYSLADLRKNQISLSSASDFNDPSDTPFFLWAEEQISNSTNEKDKTIRTLLTDAYKDYRMRCFVSDSPYPTPESPRPTKFLDVKEPYLDLVMWAHYADYHKGFCAEYKFPHDLNFPTMDNGDLCRFVELKYKDSLPCEPDISYKDGFLTKGKRWEYEHEKRLMFYGKEKPAGHPEIKLTEGCLKSVYIGVKCSEEHRAEILDIMKAYPEVNVYQMEISKTDLFKMHARLIRRGQAPQNDERHVCCLGKIWNWVRQYLCTKIIKC